MSKYQKLDPEFKEKWIKALRSGEYIQGENYLARLEANTVTVSYCCLGVAGCIIGIPKEKMYGQGTLGDIAFDSGASFPEPLLRDRNLIDDLIDLNDGLKSFSEIADFIEENC